MLLRAYIRRVVKRSRPIRPRERGMIVVAWKVGFSPKAAAGLLKALDEPYWTLDNPRPGRKS